MKKALFLAVGCLVFGLVQAQVVEWDATHIVVPPLYPQHVVLDAYRFATVLSNGGDAGACTVTRYSPQGVELWQTEYGEGGLTCVRLANGNVGGIYLGCNLGEDFHLARFRGGGLLEWSRTWDGNGTLDDLRDIAGDAAGNVIAVGVSETPGPVLSTGTIVKYGPTGNLLWEYSFSDSDDAWFNAVTVDSDGSIVAVGHSDHGGGNAIIVKVDANGNELWRDWAVTGPADVAGFDVIIDADHNIVMHTAMRVARYDSAGTQTDLLSAGPSEEFKAIGIDAQGAVFVAGTEHDGDGLDTVFVRKRRADWSHAWTKQYNPSDSEEDVRGLRVDAKGRVHVAVSRQLDVDHTYRAGIVTWWPSGTPRLHTFHPAKATPVAMEMTGEGEAIFVAARQLSGLGYDDQLTVQLGKWGLDQGEIDSLVQHAVPWFSIRKQFPDRNFANDANDWVRFHAHAGETYEATVQSESPQLPGVDVAVLTPDGGEVLASATAENGVTQLRWTASQPGTYVLRTYPDGPLAEPDLSDYTTSLVGNGRVSSLYSRVLDDGTNDPATGHAVARLRDGGVVLVGAVGPRAFATRLDTLGQPVWSRSYGMGGPATIHSALATREGTVAVVGRFGGDAFTMELDPGTGAVLLAQGYGGPGTDELLVIPPDPIEPSDATLADQGFVVAGATNSTGFGLRDGVVLRFSGGLTPEWATTFGTNVDERVLGAALTADGGMLLVGEHFGDRGFAARVEPDGALAWGRILGKAPRRPSAVAALPDGDFAVTGRSGSAVGGPDLDLWVARFDRHGREVWSRVLSDAGDQEGLGIAELTNGELAVVGYTEESGDRDGWVVRMDPEGGLLSQRAIGVAALHEELRAVRIQEGLGFVVAGERAMVGGPVDTKDAWVLSFDDFGNLGGACASMRDTTATVETVGVESSDALFEYQTGPPSLFTPEVSVATVPLAQAVECELLEPPEVSPPGVEEQLLFHSKTDLAWGDAGPTVGYHVVRGPLDGLPSGDYGDPIGEIFGATAFSDGEAPPAGQGWQYLIRAGNALGYGLAGFRSDGTPRGLDPTP